MKKYFLFAQTLLIADIAIASSILETENKSDALNTSGIIRKKIQQDPHYSIYETHSLPNAENYVEAIINGGQFENIYDKNISANTYVIFDIDETLLHITSANLSSKYFDKADKVFGLYAKNHNYNEKRMDKIHKTIHEQIPEILVNKEFPNYINKLQANGIKTIAISAIHNFDLDGVKLLDLRVNKLKKFGIDFSKSYPGLKPNCLSKKLDVHHSSGIISSACAKKGWTVTRFYNHYAHIDKNIHNITVPLQIIFFDDMLNNLLTMGEFCKANKLNYIGVHYTACNNLNFVAPYNAEALYYQIMIADKKSLLVNDDKVFDYLGKIFLKQKTLIRHIILKKFLNRLKFKGFLERLKSRIEQQASKIFTNETDNSK